MKKSTLVACAAALLATTPGFAKDSDALAQPIPVDERITVRETLPNGMQLLVRPHKRPAGQVSLMLRFGAGSLHETDAQQGLAHYIEHMAFNGSKHFPPGTLTKMFESIGVKFGRDQNAFTSFDQVAYTLDLPDTNPEHIEKGLLFFSDVASELLLTPEEIAKERGVILAELRTRDTARMRLMKKTIDLVAPGALIAQRLPGGIPEVINNATRDDFKAYYDKWYRPDITTLMVVGDVDGAAIAKMARKAFADWKAPETPLPTPDTGLVPITTLRAAIATEPDATIAEGSMYQVVLPEPIKTVGDYRRSLVERLATHICRERFTRRQQAGNAPYQDAAVTLQPLVAGYRLATAGFESEPDNWAAAQQAVFEEIRRMRVHGVLPAELDRARKAFLAGAEQAVESAGSAPSGQILMGWTQMLGRGRMPMSPTQRLALLQKLLPTITPAQVQATFAKHFSLDRGVCVLSMPAKGKAVADEKAVLAIAQKVAQQDVAAPAAESSVGALLAKAPTPGTIVSETKHEGLGTTKWVLSNGVVALVRPMPEAKNVILQANVYGGVLDETAANRGISWLVATAMGPDRAATKRHSPSQISDFLNDKKVNVGLVPGELGAGVLVTGPPADLVAGCELAHVLLAEPKITPASLADAKRQIASNLQQLKKQLPAQVIQRLRGHVAKGDVRMTSPKNDVVQAITLEAAQAWLDRLVSQSPVEVVIVGKITLDEAKDLALRYFGSLSKREDGWQALRTKRKFAAAQGPSDETIDVETISPGAFVMGGWIGIGKGDPALRASLVQAGEILSGRLREEIREKRGLTYSAMAGYRASGFDGVDQLAMGFMAAPDKVVEAAKIARELAEAFGASGPTEEEAKSTASTIKSQLVSARQNPQFWLRQLTRSTVEPTGLDGVANFFTHLEKVDAAAIKAAVQQVIQADRFHQVIGMPMNAAKKPVEKAPDPKGDPK